MNFLLTKMFKQLQISHCSSLFKLMYIWNSVYTLFQFNESPFEYVNGRHKIKSVRETLYTFVLTKK